MLKGLTRMAGPVLVAILLGACGVPAETEPHAVDLPRRPFTSSSPSTAASSRPGELAEVLCLVRDGRLVQVVRRVQTQPSAQLQAEHLVAAPDESERAAGLTTALAGLSMTVQVTTGPVQVEIIGTDESSSRNDETIGYAQIVCTLTTRPDVRSVVFTRSGERLDVPRADGSLSREPLYSSDYASLVGPA